MAWRGLHISRPARLRLRNRRIEVEQDDGEVGFPLEDVAWVVLDTPQVNASAALLSACMEAGVPLVVCDGRHMPCGTLLPFHQHFRQAEVAHLQIKLTLPTRKRLWQAIVQGKLVNQADCLDRHRQSGGFTMRQMAARTRSGDPDNVEARAARYYWSRLFEEFRRQDEQDRRNALLNYGYAVLRAAIARSLVASGLLPAFGLHHRSVQNPFNLADDLIEPFRPFVDSAVYVRCDGAADHGRSGGMTLEDRRTMAAVLTHDALSEGEQVSVLVVIDRTVASLARLVADPQRVELSLPRLAG